jgi:O-acetylhomoserine/O-acetylserine sulfhydrylase-like pyridoxal-dependent enzyme
VKQRNPHRPGREYTSRTFPVVPPIYQTTTFELDDIANSDIQSTGGLRETWYSRFRNPTADACSRLPRRRSMLDVIFEPRRSRGHAAWTGPEKDMPWSWMRSTAGDCFRK